MLGLGVGGLDGQGRVPNNERGEHERKVSSRKKKGFGGAGGNTTTRKRSREKNSSQIDDVCCSFQLKGGASEVQPQSRGKLKDDLPKRESGKWGE